MTSPSNDTYQAVLDAMRRIEERTTPIVCHPDDVDLVQRAVGRLPYAGLLPVRSSELVPPGTMYVVGSQPDLWKRRDWVE